MNLRLIFMITNWLSHMQQSNEWRWHNEHNLAEANNTTSIQNTSKSFMQHESSVPFFSALKMQAAKNPLWYPKPPAYSPPSKLYSICKIHQKWSKIISTRTYLAIIPGSFFLFFLFVLEFFQYQPFVVLTFLARL